MDDRRGEGSSVIRRAQPSEAATLTELARRSKAHWGYSPALMEQFVPDIVIDAADVARGEVWVLEVGTRIVGVLRIAPGDPAHLEDLWVEPGVIGTGHGRRLWEHAVATARSQGSRTIELEADPNAQGFYERMGAVRVGDAPSTRVPGRSLPRMRYELA